MSYIRFMIRKDLPDLLAIEEQCQDQPWPEEQFLKLLRQRHCVGLTAEIGEQIVGHVVYQLFKSQVVIRRIAVHPNFQRKRIGTQLVQRPIDKLSHYRNYIEAYVRESNLTCQLFLRKLGFKATKIFREFCPDTNEDVYLFTYQKKSET